MDHSPLKAHASHFCWSRLLLGLRNMILPRFLLGQCNLTLCFEFCTKLSNSLHASIPVCNCELWIKQLVGYKSTLYLNIIIVKGCQDHWTYNCGCNASSLRAHLEGSFWQISAIFTIDDWPNFVTVNQTNDTNAGSVLSARRQLFFLCPGAPFCLNQALSYLKKTRV